MTIVFDTSVQNFDDILTRLRRLESADTELVSPPLRRALVTLTAYAKSIAHVDTGRMRASLRPEGPYKIGVGALEGVITPVDVEYAKYEVRRGGDHDYAGRTIDEQRGVIEALAQELAADIAAFVRGA